MEYQEVEVLGQKHIIIDLGNEEYKSFPADENNLEYVAFLEQLETDK